MYLLYVDGEKFRLFSSSQEAWDWGNSHYEGRCSVIRLVVRNGLPRASKRCMPKVSMPRTKCRWI